MSSDTCSVSGKTVWIRQEDDESREESQDLHVNS